MRKATCQTANTDNEDLVERKRKDQGLHECEVFAHQPEGMESSRTWATCTKNPGHVGFIPYPELTLEHLPGVHRTPDTLGRVRQLAGRTVRVKVSYTSRERPDGYAFSNVRGTDVVHTGSGWMDHVRSNDDDDGIPCPCPECAGSPSPRLAWHTVWVFTACHVVYNAEEARATQVDFFYDDENAAVEGRVETISGFDVTFRDPVRDVCIMGCVTHDLDLARRLDALCLFSKMSEKPPFVPDVKDAGPGVGEDCVIVSHPHGLAKRVTVGQVVGLENTGSWEVLAYNTRTCAGTSGAAVLRLAADVIDVTFYPHLHSRGGDLNHASAFYYRPLHHRSTLYSRLQ